MKRQKLIGWLLFVIGLLYFGIASAPWSSFPGGLILHIFIAVLVMSGGWALAHPKRKSE